MNDQPQCADLGPVQYSQKYLASKDINQYDKLEAKGDSERRAKKNIGLKKLFVPPMPSPRTGPILWGLA